VIGASGDELAYGVQQTADLGYIVSGQSTSFGTGGNEAMLIKLNSSGIVNWTRGYGGSLDDYAISVTTTSDGGYAFTGRTSSFGGGNGDVYLVRTDAAGLLQWSKTFGGAALDQGNNIKQAADSGFVVAGYTLSYGAGGREAYLIKTDASGNGGGCSTTSPVTLSTFINFIPLNGPSDTSYSANGTPVTAQRRPGSIFDTLCGVFTVIPLMVHQGISIVAFPNPTRGFIIIESENNNPIQSVSVCDMEGRLLNSIGNLHSKFYTLHLEGLSAGIYFLDCLTANGSQKVRVVKY
jgi:hypothetical protein